MKKRAGRSQKAVGDEKYVELRIPVTPAQMKQIEAAAGRGGDAMATWARETLLAVATHGLPWR